MASRKGYDCDSTDEAEMKVHRDYRISIHIHSFSFSTIDINLSFVYVAHYRSILVDASVKDADRSAYVMPRQSSK